MKTEDEIRQKIHDLYRKEKGTKGIANYSYVTMINTLEWVLEEESTT